MNGKRFGLLVIALLNFELILFSNGNDTETRNENNSGKADTLKITHLNYPIAKSAVKISENFNVSKSWDFENRNVGTYYETAISQDFQTEVITYAAPVDIVMDRINGADTKVMRMTNWANDLWHGFGMDVPLGQDYDEIYVSYNWKFSDEFNSTEGGKLPGLTGLPIDPDMGPNLPRSGYGFRADNMFKQGGSIISYHYDRTPHSYSTVPWATSNYNFNPIYFSNGTWYNITQRLVMNTFTNGIPNADGIKELWVDGRLIFQEVNLILMEDESSTMKIDAFRLSIYYGGDTDDYRPLYESYGYIDNIKVYLPSDDPVSGHSLHDGYEILQTPDPINDRRVFYDKLISATGRLSNSEYGSVYSPCIDETYLIDAGEGNTVTYTLDDYDLAGKDFLFFYDGNTTDASLLKMFRGATSGTNEVISSSGRYLFVRFSTDNNSSSYGWSGSVSFSNIPYIPTVPDSPSNLSTGAITASTVGLKWNDNSSNETGFEIERSGPNDYTVKKRISLLANVTAYTDADIKVNSSYQYKIRALNAQGYSGYSNTLNVNSPVIVLPVAPTSLETQNVTVNGILIQWRDNSSDEVNFEIERSGPNDYSVKKLISLNANITSYSDTDIKINSKYQYRIRAHNNNGYSDYSNVIEVSTPDVNAPSAPSMLKSQEFTESSITIKWNDNSENENGFNIKRTTALDLTDVEIINVNADDTAYTDQNLIPNTTYIYSVEAVNEAGISPSSNKDIAHTLSIAEAKRVKDGLIAYYNFSYSPDNIIRDLSGYSEPLNMRILQPTAVSWNDAQKLSIHANTAIVSVAPARKIVDAIKRTGEVTMECWIKPLEPTQISTSRIVSLGNNDAEIGFIMDQEYALLDNAPSLNYGIRLQTMFTNASGYPELRQKNNIAYINLQHLVYVRDSLGKESIYVNGNKNVEGFRPSDLTIWRDTYYLRFANESDQNMPWLGSFFSAAIYNRALTPNEVLFNYSLGPTDSVTNDGIKYNLNLYPNPASEWVTIELSPQEFQVSVPQTIVKLFDIYGKVYHEETIFNPESQFEKTIDIKGFSKGIYFLQINSGNQFVTSKLIIQ